MRSLKILLPKNLIVKHNVYVSFVELNVLMYMLHIILCSILLCMVIGYIVIFESQFSINDKSKSKSLGATNYMYPGHQISKYATVCNNYIIMYTLKSFICRPVSVWYCYNNNDKTTGYANSRINRYLRVFVYQRTINIYNINNHF